MIDFALARTKHLLWKVALRSFLEGSGGLTEAQAVSHRDCDLGKWMYADGLRKFGHLPDMQQLEKVHVQLHAVVKNVVKMKHAGDAAGAEEEFKKLEPLSKTIVGLLNQLEHQIMPLETQPSNAYRAARPQ